MFIHQTRASLCKHQPSFIVLFICEISLQSCANISQHKNVISKDILYFNDRYKLYCAAILCMTNVTYNEM